VAAALGITLALGALGAAPAFADITVTTTSDSATPGDGQCSLREAIALSADCPGAAGSGATTIDVPAGTYTLSDELNVLGGANLVIRGASTSDPSQTTINRASDAAKFRLMRIDGGAIVTLDGLALRGGHPPDGSAGAPGTNGLPGNPGVAGGVGTGGGMARLVSPAARSPTRGR
jgi:CSLREA domain-containing protein